MVARRVEHHLVDDHVLVPCRVVAAPLRVVGHGEPLAAAVRECLHRAPAAWPVELQRLQHCVAVEQINRQLPSRRKIDLDDRRTPARYLAKQRCTVGKITPRGHRQAVQIHRTVAAVVNLHPVNGALAGEVHLVQAKRLAKRRTAHVRRARRGVGEQKPLGASAWFAADRPAVQHHVGPDRRHHGLAVRLRQINRHRRLDAEPGGRE